MPSLIKIDREYGSCPAPHAAHHILNFLERPGVLVIEVRNQDIANIFESLEALKKYCFVFENELKEFAPELKFSFIFRTFKQSTGVANAFFPAERFQALGCKVELVITQFYAGFSLDEFSQEGEVMRVNHGPFLQCHRDSLAALNGRYHEERVGFN